MPASYFYEEDPRCIEFYNSGHAAKKWDASREKPIPDFLDFLGGPALVEAVPDFNRERGPIVEMGCKIASNANMMRDVMYLGVEQGREFCEEAKRRHDGNPNVFIINEPP